MSVYNKTKAKYWISHGPPRLGSYHRSAYRRAFHQHQVDFPWGLSNKGCSKRLAFRPWARRSPVSRYEAAGHRGPGALLGLRMLRLPFLLYLLRPTGAGSS